MNEPEVKGLALSTLTDLGKELKSLEQRSLFTGISVSERVRNMMMTLTPEQKSDMLLLYVSIAGAQMSMHLLKNGINTSTEPEDK